MTVKNQGCLCIYYSHINFLGRRALENFGNQNNQLGKAELIRSIPRTEEATKKSGMLMHP